MPVGFDAYELAEKVEAWLKEWCAKILAADAGRTLIERLAALEAQAAAMREPLAWALGWMNAEAAMSGLKRGDNSAIDGHLDWIKRANAALASGAGRALRQQLAVAGDPHAELEALRLVHLEARELVGEADQVGAIPQANVDALRALLWRASMKRSLAAASTAGEPTENVNP